MPIFQDVARFLMVVSLLLSNYKLFAQDFELFQLQSAHYTKQNLRDASIDGKIGFFEWGAQVNVPQIFKKNKHTILMHKLGYANVTANTEVSLPIGKVESTQYYHSIIYNLGLIQSLNLSWRLIANFIPTLASDFGEKLSGNDLLFQANALVVNTKNKKIKYGFGLAYTTRFGRQLMIPMGLFKWDAQKFEVDMVLPNKLSAMVNSKKNYFSFGIKAGLNGGVFNNSSMFQTVSGTIDEVGYSRLTIGPAIRIRLKDAININLHGGFTVNRRLEFIDSNDEIIDRTPKATPFVGVGISFAPKLNQSQLKLNM